MANNEDRGKRPDIDLTTTEDDEDREAETPPLDTVKLATASFEDATIGDMSDPGRSDPIVVGDETNDCSGISSEASDTDGDGTVDVTRSRSSDKRREKRAGVLNLLETALTEEVCGIESGAVFVYDRGLPPAAAAALALDVMGDVSLSSRWDVSMETSSRSDEDCLSKEERICRLSKPIIEWERRSAPSPRNKLDRLCDLRSANKLLEGRVRDRTCRGSLRREKLENADRETPTELSSEEFDTLSLSTPEEGATVCTVTSDTDRRRGLRRYC